MAKPKIYTLNVRGNGSGFPRPTIERIGEVFLGMGTKRDTILVHDLSVTTSYGLWVCPECKSKFYGGGSACHNRDCSKSNYDGLEYHFGDNQIQRAKEVARKHNDDRYAWYGISVALLKEKMPDVLTGGPSEQDATV